MKTYKYFFFIFIAVIVSGCNKDDTIEIIDCQEGCNNISEIKTQYDYYLPFSLVNDNDTISKIILNNETLNIPFSSSYQLTENGFYELILFYKNELKKTDTILFTITSKEREYSEWGIKAWLPAPFETTLLSAGDIESVYPRFYTDGIKVPFIFYISESGVRKPVYLNASYNNSDTSFYIKQGVGSANISTTKLNNQPGFNIGGRQVDFSLSKKETPDLVLSGNITENIVIPANSFVKITDNLNIQAGASLTVGEGTLIIIDEAVDINHSAPITFNGTKNNPVFITCSDENKFWGGFITSSSNGKVEATYTIFCQSGYHNTSNYIWGHAQRQALFYTDNSTLKMVNCYMLDHIGQIFYPQNSTLTLNNILIQRVKTSGQINTSTITIDNSIFTDFPDDSRIFRDDDNDALYIHASDATISNSIFMFAKDDGLDSGGGLGGTILLTNCRFESCFHEGAALSSDNSVVKNHTFVNCYFTNCGQGLELGFSSPNHTIISDNCTFYRNGIGVRYGDNYDWSNINGRMFIKNSSCIENNKDVWNMVRMDWKPKLQNMIFENTTISKFCPQYPNLTIHNN